jgi:hypothetical protein
MPKWMTAAFALFLSLQVFSTKGETVDDVINRYIHTMGGKDRLRSINTLYSEGLATGKNGGLTIVKTNQVKRKSLRRETLSQADTNVIIVTSLGPDNYSLVKVKPNILLSEAVQSWQNYLDCENSLIDYGSSGYKAELLGKEKINGCDCYNIKLVMNSGMVVSYFIGAESFLILRRISRSKTNTAADSTNNSEVVIDYSDYRKTPDGYLFPYQQNVNAAITIKFSTIEVNKPVANKLYHSK